MSDLPKTTLDRFCFFVKYFLRSIGFELLDIESEVILALDSKIGFELYAQSGSASLFFVYDKNYNVLLLDKFL